MHNEITFGDIHGAFPRTITALASLMEEFRSIADEDPRQILRELDDPRDDAVREGIMQLAAESTDPRIRQWYSSLEEMAALRYAKRRMGEIEIEHACRLDPIPCYADFD